MRNRILLFLFLVFSNYNVLAQNENDLVIYLDSLERFTTQDQADYVRVIVNFHGKSLHCKVYDYYQSGSRKMVGSYANKYTRSKTGPFMIYYENGKLKSQIQYVDDKPQGRAYFWHENGSKKAECEFGELDSDGVPAFRINHYWSRIGIQRVIDGKGHFTDEDVTSFSEGELANGVKHGEWRGTDYKDRFTFVETYKKGRLVSGISTDSLKRNHHYTKVYVPAVPHKGYAHFDRYFQKQLRRNKDLKKENLIVTVGISFTIQSDGNIADLKVLEYEDSKIDETIREIFKNYGTWNPAQSRGINTESYLSVPIPVNRY